MNAFYQSPIRPTLGFGSEGEYVRKLQYLLNRAGASVAEDGIFRIETQEEVQRFQESLKLKPSGIVGPLTWSALEGIPIGDLGELSKEREPQRAVTGVEQAENENRLMDERLNGLRGVTVVDVVRSRTQSSDSYISKLIKYIPSELLAVYLTLRSLVLSTEPINMPLYWVVFLFGVLMTPLYIWRIQTQKTSQQLTNWRIIFISTGAFIVWAISTGGPFDEYCWYEPVYGGILLVAYTFLVPLL